MMGKKRGSKVRWDLIGVGALGIVAAAIVAGALVKSPPPANESVATLPPAVLATPTKASARTEPYSIEEIRGIVASNQPVTISILGDSTGDGPGEWVDLWAKHLSASHTVRYFLWNDSTQSYPINPEVTGSGPELNIWNGSRAGSTAKYAIDRYGVIQPQKPNLVVYNYGHNNKGTDAADLLKSLSAKLQARYGSTAEAITLQNPSQGTRAAQTEQSVSALQAYASETGTAAIDVHSAFAGIPMRGMLVDEVHPNPEGSKIWVDAVIKALG